MRQDQPVFAEERRQRIADLVVAHGRVRLADLVDALGVTEPTIRKDLDELQRRRLLRRTHGGAIAVQAHQEMHVHDRRLRHRAAKELIARACRDEITRGQSLFLDSGTTVEAITDALDVPDINILTNSVAVANAVADRPAVRHTLIGGQLRRLSGSLVGPVALQTLTRFSVDIAFIGATGVAEDGVTVADVSEAQIKQSVIERARRVILPLDSSKFGAIDFVSVCGLDRIDMIVTERATPEAVRLCEAHRVTLRTAAG